MENLELSVRFTTVYLAGGLKKRLSEGPVPQGLISEVLGTITRINQVGAYPFDEDSLRTVYQQLLVVGIEKETINAIPVFEDYDYLKR